MNYIGQTASSNPPTPASVIEAGVNLNSRLRDVLTRISRVGDSLHGSVPKPISNEKNAEAQMNSVRHNLEVGAAILNEIEIELNRVEGNL